MSKVNRKTILGKLSINIEKLPKHYFEKKPSGTYLNVDMAINLDDPKIFENEYGVKLEHGSFSKPQTKEERDNKTKKEYFKGMYFNVNTIGEMKEVSKDQWEWKSDNEWKESMNKLKGTKEEAPQVAEASDDLPF